MKLSEALKNLTGLTTACMIQDVRNDNYFQIFIDAYKIVGLLSSMGCCPEHVESARIEIEFKKNIVDSEIKLGS